MQSSLIPDAGELVAELSLVNYYFLKQRIIWPGDLNSWPAG
jgi:hypothetical protein